MNWREKYAPQNKYLKENMRTYVLRANKKTEKELCDKLDSMSNISGYIKTLVKNDIIKIKKEENKKMTNEQKMEKWEEIVRAFFEKEMGDKTDYITTESLLDKVNCRNIFDDEFCDEFWDDLFEVVNKVAREHDFAQHTCQNGEGAYIGKTKEAYTRFANDFEDTLSRDSDFWDTFRALYGYDEDEEEENEED